jgi:hypothetical protein
MSCSEKTETPTPTPDSRIDDTLARLDEMEERVSRLEVLTTTKFKPTETPIALPTTTLNPTISPTPTPTSMPTVVPTPLVTPQPTLTPSPKPTFSSVPPDAVFTLSGTGEKNSMPFVLQATSCTLVYETIDEEMPSSLGLTLFPVLESGSTGTGIGDSWLMPRGYYRSETNFYGLTPGNNMLRVKAPYTRQWIVWIIETPQ